MRVKLLPLLFFPFIFGWTTSVNAPNTNGALQLWGDLSCCLWLLGKAFRTLRRMPWELNGSRYSRWRYYRDLRHLQLKLHVVSEAARDSVFCGRIYFGDTCPYPESLCKIRPGMACRTSDTRTHGKAAKGPVYDIEVCYFGWKKIAKQDAPAAQQRTKYKLHIRLVTPSFATLYGFLGDL